MFVSVCLYACLLLRKISNVDAFYGSRIPTDIFALFHVRCSNSMVLPRLPDPTEA